MKGILWLVPAFALAAQAGTITREGNYWVDTVTGSAPVEQALRVATQGGVTVEGTAAGDVVTYTLKRRVKASNENAARGALDKIGVKTRRDGGWTVLDVTLCDSSRCSAEIRLQVPRRLREVVLATGGGAIQAIDLDGTLRADTGGGPVQVDRVQSAVTVRTGGGSVRVGKIGGKLECFTGGGAITAEILGSSSALNTGGGQIVVREAKDVVHARTGGGSIRVEKATHGVEAFAGGGLIDVVEAGGPVLAETGGGSIKVRSSTNVQCKSGAGTIQLQSVTGALRAVTSAGSIVADLSGAAGFQDSVLTTGLGDITVLIPSNLAVTIEATNHTPGSRRIVSDFPEIRPRVEGGDSRSQAGGTLHGGGPVLRLVATGGTIYLRQQK